MGLLSQVDTTNGEDRKATDFIEAQKFMRGPWRKQTFGFGLAFTQSASEYD